MEGDMYCRTITVAILMLLISACQADEKTATVRGTVEPCGLPGAIDPVLTIGLVHLESGNTIAWTTISNPLAGPNPFELRYDPDEIDPIGSFVVNGRVVDSQGRPICTTLTPVPVITQGHSSTGITLTLATAN
jgi:uncharacterized lipoprotein YbaY